MEVQNAEFRAIRDDETDMVVVYEQGSTEPLFEIPFVKFAALRAIIEQMGG